MNWYRFDWYKRLVRPLLFLFPPELALSFALIAIGAERVPVPPFPKALPNPVEAFGLRFRHPVGLAAGFDKNGSVLAGLFRLGFSFVEIGAVTPRLQLGNPEPRFFRDMQHRAFISRIGYANAGLEAVCVNISRWRESNPPADHMLGVNIAANLGSEDPLTDYVTGMRRLAKLADYISISIPGAVTANSYNLQDKQILGDLIQHLQDVRAAQGSKLPLILKLSPDLKDDALSGIVEVALAQKIDGLTVGDASLLRPKGLPLPFSRQSGGLSGQPLFDYSTRFLRKTSQLVAGQIPIIGVGGIGSGLQAQAKRESGAALVQVYSGFLYEGPQLLSQIVDELLKKQSLI